MSTGKINSNPAVMMGKPVISGTRITVELILEKLGAGESVERGSVKLLGHRTGVSPNVGIYWYMPTFGDSRTHARSGSDRVMELARGRRILRPRDLRPFGLDPILLRRLYAAGRLERRARGIYVPTDGKFSEQQMLAETAIRIPHSVICLLSTLRFHDLTTQNPTEIWLAIDHHARTPREPELPLRIVRFSGAALTAGVDVHTIDGTAVRVYDAAKTVADCFKFRNKIGVDVAIEALRDYLRRRNRNIDALWRYAEIDRVRTVMQPYLEAVA